MNEAWINPILELPSVDIKDEFLTYGHRSKKVLVQMKRSTAMGGNYHALAVYRVMTYPDGTGNKSFWDIEHHTGNWDDKVVGWVHIPQILNQNSQ